jgi:hypothetical protein
VQEDKLQSFSRLAKEFSAMKKHILGFVIFGLIIGVSVFVYGVFVVKNNKTSCVLERIKDKEISEAVVKNDTKILKQAVLNIKTNQLTLDFQRTSTGQPIALHFFVKDSEMPKYNFTEYVFTDASQYKIDLPQLSRINYHNNLYIIAEAVTTEEAFGDKKSVKQFFDADKAISVLYDFNYKKIN